MTGRPVRHAEATPGHAGEFVDFESAGVRLLHLVVAIMWFTHQLWLFSTCFHKKL